MGWVTLDDGQHVLIGSSGKVLATRAQISSASGGKERGQALAARSKAAIAHARARPDLHLPPVARAKRIKAKAAAESTLKDQVAKARAAKGDSRQRAEAVVSRLKKVAFSARNEAMRLYSKPSKLRGWEKEALAKLDAKTDRNFKRSDAIRAKHNIG